MVGRDLVVCGPSSPMTQTTFDSPTDEPKQNNYERIIKLQQQVINEMTWLRHEWEDNKRDLFDLNELVGMLVNNIRVQNRKIEEWVGVAEE